MFIQAKKLLSSVPALCIAASLTLTACEDLVPLQEEAQVGDFQADQEPEELEAHGEHASRTIGPVDMVKGYPCLKLILTRHPDVALDIDVHAYDAETNQYIGSAWADLVGDDRAEVRFCPRDFGKSVNKVRFGLSMHFIRGDRNTGGGDFLRDEVVGSY